MQIATLTKNWFVFSLQNFAIICNRVSEFIEQNLMFYIQKIMKSLKKEILLKNYSKPSSTYLHFFHFLSEYSKLIEFWAEFLRMIPNFFNQNQLKRRLFCFSDICICSSTYIVRKISQSLTSISSVFTIRSGLSVYTIIFLWLA